MRAAVVGLVALLAGGATAADPVALRWKLAKGDTFYVRSVNDMQQTIGVLGQTMEQQQTTTTVARFKVLEAGADKTVLEQTITKVDIVGNLPGAADLAGNMKGATLTFTLDKDYKVTKVDGYEKYIDRISGGNEQVAQVVKAASSEDALKASVEDLLNPGPGKPVAPGDKWTRETKLALGPLGNFTVNGRYALDGVDAGVAKVSYDADASFTPGKGGDGLPFQITKGELKADKYTGTLAFDTAAGRLKEVTQNVKLGGSLTVSAMGNEIELTFQQTLKVTGTVTPTDPGD